MTTTKTAAEIAKELRDDHADGLGSGLLLEAADKLTTQATAIRAMNNTVNGIVGEVEKYESAIEAAKSVLLDATVHIEPAEETLAKIYEIFTPPKENDSE